MKGGTTMLKLLEKIADFAYEYGKEGAGMPSLRGNYEAAAPKELMNDEQND